MHLNGDLYILLLITVVIWLVLKYFNRYKITIFIILFPSFLFIKFLEQLIKEELAVFDETIYGYKLLKHSSQMTLVMKGITFMGSATFFIMFTIISFFVFKRLKYTLYAKLIAINLVVTWMLNELFKLLIQRPRPDLQHLVHVTGYSFPSGHSMVSMSFYGLIIYYLLKMKNKRYLNYLMSFVMSLLIFSIGLSRVYLGVHYASDVLAGFSVGLAWLGLFITFTNRHKLRTTKNIMK